MITYWKEVDKALVKVSAADVTDGERAWIDARAVTRADVEKLIEDYKIDGDHVQDILDIDELARLEEADEYILTILRLPLFDAGNAQYSTLPLGVIIKGPLFITICSSDCEVLKDFSLARVRGVTLADFPAFIMRIIARANLTFLRYLKEINRRSLAIQAELLDATENKEVMQLFALQKSLVYFTTSLKSNQLLLERYRKTRLIRFDSEDVEWLDDVEIDNHQAMQMAETYQNVLTSVTDAFDSVVNNNLNISMRRLSILNILMMVPTFITSFWGMNIELPIANYGRWAVVILFGLCVLSVFVTNILISVVERHKPTLKRESPQRKLRKKKEAEAAKRLRAIEEVLSED